MLPYKLFFVVLKKLWRIHQIIDLIVPAKKTWAQDSDSEDEDEEEELDEQQQGNYAGNFNMNNHMNISCISRCNYFIFWKILLLSSPNKFNLFVDSILC